MNNTHNYDERPIILNPNFDTPSRAPRRLNQAQNRAFRRQSLLASAIKVVARYDIQGATVERICTQAGASRGLIAHYYQSKQALLLAALTDWLDTALEVKTQIANDSDLTAVNRLRNVSYASFESPSYRWETAAAWQAFTNASRYDKAYAQPIREGSLAIIQLLTDLFEQAGKERNLKLNAQTLAIGLHLLDDGLWNSLATGKDNLNVNQAKGFCDQYLNSALKLI